MLGFSAGTMYIVGHYMKTMVPLRLREIGANILFVSYGVMYPSYPTLALYRFYCLILSGPFNLAGAPSEN